MLPLEVGSLLYSLLNRKCLFIASYEEKVIYTFEKLSREHLFLFLEHLGIFQKRLAGKNDNENIFEEFSYINPLLAINQIICSHKVVLNYTKPQKNEGRRYLQKIDMKGLNYQIIILNLVSLGVSASLQAKEHTSALDNPLPSAVKKSNQLRGSSINSHPVFTYGENLGFDQSQIAQVRASKNISTQKIMADEMMQKRAKNIDVLKHMTPKERIEYKEKMRIMHVSPPAIDPSRS